MTLNFGKPQVSIPGPSIIPDRVLAAMHRPAPNIYAGALADLTARIKVDLASVARTTGDALIYIGNGHAGWEAALSNVVSPGDKLLALTTGRFCAGWAEMARALGAEVEVMDFGTADTFDADQVEARLRMDKDQAIVGVLTVHTDTASSVRNDIPSLRAAMDAAGHEGLLMVDCIASLGCEPFEMDAWGVDVMVAGCQKGLMTPPGLAFNFVGPKASAHRDKVSTTTGYWDWRMRQTPDIYYMNFYGTAPTHHLYGLGEALDMLLRDEGLEAAWARHDVLAQAHWAALDAWATEGAISMNVADPAKRSTAVTTIHCEGADQLRAFCEEKTGLTLGIGLDLGGSTGAQPAGTFRIGHMGHLNPPMVFGTLGTIETGLQALGIAHGTGAIEAAAKVMANALT